MTLRISSVKNNEVEFYISWQRHFERFDDIGLIPNAKYYELKCYKEKNVLFIKSGFPEIETIEEEGKLKDIHFFIRGKDNTRDKERLKLKLDDFYELWKAIDIVNKKVEVPF